MKTDDDIINYREEDFLYSPRSAYRYMLWKRGKDGLAGDIYSWFQKNQPEKLKVLEGAGSYKLIDAKISEENAQ